MKLQLHRLELANTRLEWRHLEALRWVERVSKGDVEAEESMRHALKWLEKARNRVRWAILVVSPHISGRIRGVARKKKPS